MTIRKYQRIIFALVAVLFGGIVAVNFVVNPLGIYPTPVVEGFNDKHPAAIPYARLQKTEAIKRLKPDMIITGTSRADLAFDPLPELFPGKVTYNAALSAATIHEQRRMLEFAHRVRPLKQAIITLDFFAFNARMLENKQFEMKRVSEEALLFPQTVFNTYGTLVSLDTLQAVFKHLRGMRRIERQAYANARGQKMDADLAHHAVKHGAGHPFWHMPAPKEVFVDAVSFDYSKSAGDTTFQHLEAMLDFTRKKNIDVILLISPVHETYLKMLEDTGKGVLERDWKKRVTEIIRANGAKYGAAPYPFWDFARRDAITTEAVPKVGDMKAPMRWWWDPSHCKGELGEVVLRKTLGLPVSDAFSAFGVRVF